MLLILGGGILGTLIAWEATTRGHQVVCVRRSDAQAPEAETLRNQAWLQSGLVPHRRIGVDDALTMWVEGRRMLRDLAFDPDAGDPGVLRAPDDVVDDIEKAIDEMVLRNFVKPLSPSTAQQRAGVFFRQGGTFYEIPDRPFPEAEIVQDARDRALATRLARFIEVQGPASMRRLGQTIEVTANGETLVGDAFVLAAGYGSLQLLDSLPFSHGLKATSTPLVVIKNASAAELWALCRSREGLLVQRDTRGAGLTHSRRRARALSSRHP